MSGRVERSERSCRSSVAKEALAAAAERTPRKVLKFFRFLNCLLHQHFFLLLAAVLTATEAMRSAVRRRRADAIVRRHRLSAASIRRTLRRGWCCAHRLNNRLARIAALAAQDRAVREVRHRAAARMGRQHMRSLAPRKSSPRPINILHCVAIRFASKPPSLRRGARLFLCKRMRAARTLIIDVTRIAHRGSHHRVKHCVAVPISVEVQIRILKPNSFDQICGKKRVLLLRIRPWITPIRRRDKSDRAPFHAPIRPCPYHPN